MQNSEKYFSLNQKETKIMNKVKIKIEILNQNQSLKASKTKKQFHNNIDLFLLFSILTFYKYN